MGPCYSKDPSQHNSRAPAVIPPQNWILDEHIEDDSWQFGSEAVDRVPYSDMKNLHNRLLGAIICKGPLNTIQTGTGMLISPNLVLTCAHVIVNAR